MKHDLDPQQEGHQRSDRKPETVEGGQGIEQHVGRVDRDMRADLLDVGQEIEMRKCNALRLAFRTGREKEDRRRAVPRARDDETRHTLPDCRCGLVAERQFRAYVLEVDDLGDAFQFRDQRVEFAEFDEPPRRDDPLDLGHVHRRADRRRAGGKVQHRRNASVGRYGEEGDDRPGAGRQHDADRLAGPRALPERVAQRQRRPHDLVVGELTLVAVHDRRALAPEGGTRLRQRLEQRLLGARQIKRHDLLAGRRGNGGQSHEVLLMRGKLSHTARRREMRIAWIRPAKGSRGAAETRRGGNKFIVISFVFSSASSASFAAPRAPFARGTAIRVIFPCGDYM